MFLMKLLPRGFVAAQSRKPSGIFGRWVMARVFNRLNTDLNTFIREVLDPQRSDRILEIGFGPGALIHELADMTPDSHVEGIDFSGAMVAHAAQHNRRHISAGRVRLHEGECSTLPFGDETFDSVCTANTIYFWKEPRNCLSEIFRVLKPGGKVVIGFRDAEQMSKLNLDEDYFRLYSRGEVVDLLSDAGFSGACVQEKNGVPFDSYCATARKG